VRFWHPLMFEPMEQLAEAAHVLEEAGFEGAGLADHVVVPVGFRSMHPSGESPFTPESSFPDTFSTIAALSMVTQRLRYMSYVYIIPLRDPFTVAKQVATTATLSGNRVVLGAGAGWLEEEFLVLGRSFADRGARLDEALEVIEDFWQDGVVRHSGTHYSFEEAAMFPLPTAPIPIWVGGKSRAALRRAAGHDGWLGMNYPLDEIDQLLKQLSTCRDEVPRGAEPFEVFVIPNAAPSLDLYRQLEDMGVTSTMGMGWYPGDPAGASIEAKRAGAGRFSEQFIEPLR
jgi:probable F420-dependent oxidoreductase